VDPPGAPVAALFGDEILEGLEPQAVEAPADQREGPAERRLGGAERRRQAPRPGARHPRAELLLALEAAAHGGEVALPPLRLLEPRGVRGFEASDLRVARRYVHFEPFDARRELRDSTVTPLGLAALRVRPRRRVGPAPRGAAARPALVEAVEALLQTDETRLRDARVSVEEPVDTLQVALRGRRDDEMAVDRRRPVAREELAVVELVHRLAEPEQLGLRVHVEVGLHELAPEREVPVGDGRGRPAGGPERRGGRRELGQPLRPVLP
jgi:hypothetical protein